MPKNIAKLTVLFEDPDAYSLSFPIKHDDFPEARNKSLANSDVLDKPVKLPQEVTDQEKTESRRD